MQSDEAKKFGKRIFNFPSWESRKQLLIGCSYMKKSNQNYKFFINFKSSASTASSIPNSENSRSVFQTFSPRLVAWVFSRNHVKKNALLSFPVISKILAALVSSVPKLPKLPKTPNRFSKLLRSYAHAKI